MPELPDVTVYVESIAARVAGQPLQGVRVASPFVVRTFDPPLSAASGRRVLEVRRLGKRIVFVLEGGLFLVIHLMIAGRFKWLERGAKIPGKVGLAALDFPPGTLMLTEAATKKRASIHLARALDEFQRGGIEPLTCTLDEFEAALRRENHTLKRSLTDPRLFSGIGNAYSDEILHRSKLSPALLTQKMSRDEVRALFEATRTVLTEWTERLRQEAREKFPEKVTAFRDDFAVHGKYKQPCPVCGTAVQRIAYADNETNYCPRCQTGGKLLSDRSLARLLHDDWPRTIEELEERFPAGKPAAGSS
ncbi:MAG: formamidopyrimidine-DNA glycosylase [Deltaproteobacteria bacterium 13_1_20CM_2_69_21]|nr:MAG: formamidopyrimidine-DNA glycosylase [Deltaproteobacteria bacterium 13_1_40CM_3_69_14]OLD46998.1 MAG: formamidopyrimidine-DNA glycosylase [Chloroflexi bacterium 13_1_40CM_2_68_14]OLE64394.1 MAG: formamidopyrimidine-DNA glycosylase [Deltaproteobacteria bacterium 13_1_20CM_2_69_21]